METLLYNYKFQSTCPARGTTFVRIDVLHDFNDFNPRAPRGARPGARSTTRRSSSISIHVPREGHDLTCSTRSIPLPYFNPRAPRGARHPQGAPPEQEQYISIHVPREGHDLTTQIITKDTTQFQSTCPARGTTANMHNFFVQICARVTNIPLKGMPYLQKTYVSI